MFPESEFVPLLFSESECDAQLQWQDDIAWNESVALWYWMISLKINTKEGQSCINLF